MEDEALPKPEQQKWYAGETISVGIGQGYNAYTPLQLAQAIATLANDGVMYRPHIVNYIENIAHAASAHASSRSRCARSTLKPEHLKVVKDALVGVNKEGTGARAFAGAGYISAGKTGTAQVIAIKQGEKYDESRVAERHRDHALFIAFAPADKPEDRARGAGRERRLRRARRGADRAPGARLLPARQEARRRSTAEEVNDDATLIRRVGASADGARRRAAAGARCCC